MKQNSYCNQQRLISHLLVVEDKERSLSQGNLRSELRGQGTNPQIRIYTEMIDLNLVKIAIADNGVGIQESLRSRLFDPFFTTKPVGKGSGLGLSISYQIIVQKHQGNITYTPSVGQGAEFAIEIPIKQPDY